MSDRFSWVIRAGYDNGDEEELRSFDDKGTALEAFDDMDCEVDGKEYDWVELAEIDWYMHSESVIDTIVRQDYD